MTDQLKNILIGLFVITAGVILVFLLLFLHPTTGDEGQTLYVRFTDIDKVTVGTRVTFAGRPVGEVVAIKEIEKDRQGPTDENGRVFVYELKLLLDSSIKVYNTDQITLRTSGLLGERSVAIIPLAPKPGETAKLVNNKEVVYAQQVGSVEESMAEFKEVADKVELALDNAIVMLDDIKKEEVVKKLGDTLANIRDISTALNKPEEWEAMLDNIQDFTSELAVRLPKSWDKVDIALDQLDVTTANTRDLTSTAKNMVVDVSKGKGSAGKILVDEDLYLRLTALLNKGDTVLNDMGHYGLLYNLDKGWQRTRARRANLLQRLATPQEFRNYFNNELDQVSTSLARVTTILDQLPPNCPECPLVCNPEFTKVFAELLRKVTFIEESLKMYDQQLMEPQVLKTELIVDQCQCGCP